VFRDERGSYIVNEWTSISDVGSSFGSTILSFDEYLKIESLYVNAVLEFMKCLSVNSMDIEMLARWNEDVSKISSYCSSEMKELYLKLEEGDTVNKDDIELLTRLALRDELGCRLKFKTDLFVHFGYDFYMYIVCSKECIEAVSNIRNSGLFVENHMSPYFEE